MTDIIAVLSHSVSAAAQRISGDVKEYSSARQKGVFKSDREFIIVTRRDQLEGVRIGDYIVAGHPDQDLIEAAKARMV